MLSKSNILTILAEEQRKWEASEREDDRQVN